MKIDCDFFFFFGQIAACIPIYKGNVKNVIMPKKFAIMIDDFPTIESLVTYLQQISESEIQSYLDWIRNPPQDFIDFWQQRQYKDILCRVCNRSLEKIFGKPKSEVEKKYLYKNEKQNEKWKITM